jgi:hypothetical protein
MPFLVVGGVTVPVMSDGGATVNRPQLGEVVRSFNGEPRSTVRGSLTDAEFTTAPINATLAASLLAVLEGAHPVVCSGDALGGTVSCAPTEITVVPVKVGSVRYSAVSFRLLGP